MSLDLIVELEAVIDALDRSSVDYALCGGLALGLHGHPRATMDIDVLVRPERVADALAAVSTIGFDIPARKIIFGLAQGLHREVSKLDPATNDLLSLDFLVVGTELEPVWAARQTFDVGGRRMVVVSREGLATMKKIAGRPQDLVDLANLESDD